MEEGKVLLSDPVSRFIPGFKHTTVALPPPTGAAPGTPVGIVAAKREITIRDLLTHTAGIWYGGGPAAAQWKAAGSGTFYFADKDEPLGAVIDRLATLPMDAQPGEKYLYGYNTDILGSVVERVSGMPLDEFFRTRIFEPLEMKDTYFYLPKDQRGRLATVYCDERRSDDTRARTGSSARAITWTDPRKCFSGGAGLLSTATDYARFLQMLLNGGELDGVRLLSPTTVELATVDHVGTLFNEGRSGFGLGFEVVGDLGKFGKPGSGRVVRVGRRLPHQLLGRSRAEDGRRHHDATPPVGWQQPPRHLPRPPLPVDHRTAHGRGRAGPQEERDQLTSRVRGPMGAEERGAKG